MSVLNHRLEPRLKHTAVVKPQSVYCCKVGTQDVNQIGQRYQNWQAEAMSKGKRWSDNLARYTPRLKEGRGWNVVTGGNKTSWHRGKKLMWVVSAYTNSPAVTVSLTRDTRHIRVVSVVFAAPFFGRFYRSSNKLSWLSWQHGSRSQRGALLLRAAGTVSDHALHCGQSISEIQWWRLVLCMYWTPPPATWWLHCKSGLTSLSGTVLVPWVNAEYIY